MRSSRLPDQGNTSRTVPLSFHVPEISPRDCTVCDHPEISFSYQILVSLMNGLSLRDPQVLGVFAAAGLCIGGVVAYYSMRKRPSEEELEKLRREELVLSGRIIDGTVIDISDLGPEECGRPNGLRLILYKYEIAGVVYECSQDVTLLRDHVDIYDCRLSFPCSVRYDPHRPVNSILIAENWSGLRDTANSVPIRRLPRKPRVPAPYV